MAFQRKAELRLAAQRAPLRRAMILPMDCGAISGHDSGGKREASR